MLTYSPPRPACWCNGRITPLALVLIMRFGTVSAAAGDPTQSQASIAQSATSRVVAAANAFLSTLDEKQQAKVLYKFDDKEQRARWSNFPTGFVPRGGISWQEMIEPQRTAALVACLKLARQTPSGAVARTHLLLAMQRIGSAGISLAGTYYLCLALTSRP